MIDLHTHILYGIDDGAKTFDESFSMLKKAYELGVEAICLTPHQSTYRTFDQDGLPVHEKVKKLIDKLRESHIDLKLFVGAEIDEHDDLIHHLENVHPLGNSKYVLIDFTMRETDVSEVIYTLKQMGYHTIVAHPERMRYVSYNDLVLLKEEGAIFQVSAKHLLPYRMSKSSRLAKRLLKHHLIDIIASDCHEIDDLDHLKKSYDYVYKKVGHELAEKWYVDNPKKILGIYESQLFNISQDKINK
jgi:protein-tyrosine phosphatase